ncbi:MAG: hypothetical protein V3V72_02460 [Ignavibacteriaceae bacterium]
MLKILIITMLLYVSSFAQTIVWYPDGTVKEWTEGKKLNEIVDKKDLEKMSAHHSCECGEQLTTVRFKFLTNEPIYVITEDSTCIRKCINDFNFYNYMHSMLVEIELGIYIEDNLLTYLYLQETLGAPDRKPKDVTRGETNELWYYDRYNLVFKIYNGYVYGFMRLE